MIDWLREERIRWRDRAGPPTISDIRETGVKRAYIRLYLKAADWRCETPDWGNAKTAPGCAHLGPPAWISPNGDLVSWMDDRDTIAEIARAENRSPWAVLDDCAYYAGAREIYRDGVVVAIVKGAECYDPRG